MSTVMSEQPIVEVKPGQVLGELNAVEAKHAPSVLYAQGDLLGEGLRVSVVGSRNPSEAGIRRTRVFCKTLLGHHITVVCGLADGIDSIAHQTAIDHGGTIPRVGPRSALNTSAPAPTRSPRTLRPHDRRPPGTHQPGQCRAVSRSRDPQN